MRAQQQIFTPPLPLFFNAPDGAKVTTTLLILFTFSSRDDRVLRHEFLRFTFIPSVFLMYYQLLQTSLFVMASACYYFVFTLQSNLSGPKLERETRGNYSFLSEENPRGNSSNSINPAPLFLPMASAETGAQHVIVSGSAGRCGYLQKEL